LKGGRRRKVGEREREGEERETAWQNECVPITHPDGT
jgi:hypothetical protein